MIVLLVALLKREGSCGGEMRSKIGIVTWDTLVSYWLIFPPLSLVTVPEVFAKVNSV